jgi:hypothetical protein
MSGIPKYIRLAYICGVFSFLGAVTAFLCGIGCSPDVTAQRDRPHLNHPGTIDLGRKDIHKNVRVLIPVTNDGTAPLVITRVETNCACQPVFDHHTMQAIKDFRLEPGESATFGVDLTVGGSFLQVSTARMRFHSNDPDDPVSELLITYLPSAALYAVPSSIVFSQVNSEVLPRFEVELYADDRSPLVSSNPIKTSLPESYAASFRQYDGEAIRLGRTNVSRIGVLTIQTLKRLDGDEERSFALDLIQGDKKILSLPITLRFPKEYLVFPSVITLPRRSGGAAVYEHTLVCSRSDEKPFEIQVRAVDPALTVTLGTPAGPARVHTLKIGVREGHRHKLGTVTFKLACIGSSGQTFDVPVSVRLVRFDQ